MLSRISDQVQGADQCNDQGEQNLRPAKTRSADQAEASRRNGAHSRGPRTAEGKIKSRRNALRHGLLAYRIRPLQEDSSLHQEYELQLKGLIREFDPVTTTEWATVETLASDLVQQGRIIEMREAQCHLEIREADGAALAPDYRGDVKVVEELVGKCEAGLDPCCDEDEVDWLAAYIVHEVEALNELVTPVRACRDAGQKLEPGEKPLLSDMDFINPKELGVLKTQQVAQVLRGAKRLDQEERKRWLRLLQRVRRSLDGELHFAGENDARNNSLRRKGWQPMAYSRMPTLELLERYHTRLRRSIERSITFLERRLAARGE